jgi:fumarylacetoacetase
MLNATHDPSLRSWVSSAQNPAGDFPIQNLPHAVFRRRAGEEGFRGGVAIGDQILDLSAACDRGAFSMSCSPIARAAGASALNGLMALGPAAWHQLRLELSRVLSEGANAASSLADCLVAQAEAEYALPVHIGDYTDFFTSWNHMINAGRIFLPDAPPLANFRHMPIGYHGRASTVAISGTPCVRPRGQTRPADANSPPGFAPCRMLDYEMELGILVGSGNRAGQPIPLSQAQDHLFGMVLLNDWSARDIQAWEAMPLGPFLAKNFLTSISPWVVTFEALEPYRCALPRCKEDPPALDYLDAGSDAKAGYDIQLEVRLQTLAAGQRSMLLSRSSYRRAYWGPAQLLAHHSSNGCQLRPGDLLGTGTQSGPGAAEQGCLLELTEGGRRPLRLENGEQRTYLQDGDSVSLHAWCEGHGLPRLGFGECRGMVLAAAGSWWK